MIQPQGVPCGAGHSGTDIRGGLNAHLSWELTGNVRLFDLYSWFLPLLALAL